MSVRKSARLRAIEGNPGHRSAKEHPKPPPVVPSCPRWLPPAARTLWRSVVPQLEELGVVGGPDVATLEAYCLTYSRWRSAEALLEKEGLVVDGHRNAPRKHPAAQLARDYQAAMLTLAKQLGLTPASRQTLDVAALSPVDEPSPWDV
jgi:P27 family predicted phage terminase small subunit